MAEFRPVNLAEIYGQIDAAKANQAQIENNRMRQQQAQYEMKRQYDEDMRNEQLRGVYRGAVENVDGTPRLNEKKLLSDVYAVDPTKALDIQEKFSKRDADAQKLKIDNKKAELAQKLETSKYFRDRLATAADQQSYDAVLMEAEQMGAGFVSGAPRAFNPEWVSKQVYTADDFIKKAENDLNRGVTMRGQDITLRGQDLTDARTRSEGALNRGVQMRGQNMTNERARESAQLTAQNNQLKPNALQLESTKKVNDANDVLNLLNQAEDILPQATGSAIGAASDYVSAAFGSSTKGASATAKLKAIQGLLVSKMPKMSGPQSDKDVLLYREMAGQIGDPTIPIDTRKAAMDTIRSINERYAGVAEGSSRGVPKKPNIMPGNERMPTANKPTVSNW